MRLEKPHSLSYQLRIFTRLPCSTCVAGPSSTLEAGLNGDDDNALTSFQVSLKIRREIGHKQGEAICLGNIGLIYRNKGDLDNALISFKDSRRISSEIGYKQGEAAQAAGDTVAAVEHFQQVRLSTPTAAIVATAEFDAAAGLLARQEWNDADIHEGLLMDTDANLVEGTMSNIFVVCDGVLLTPDLSHCGVAGVMRSIILEQAQLQGLEWRIAQLGQQHLLRADEVFLANSLIGIWPVIAIGETTYRKGPITQLLQGLLPESSNDDCGFGCGSCLGLC